MSEGARLSPARRLALEALARARTTGRYARDVVAEDARVAALSPRDKAFCLRLVLGVTAAAGALDAFWRPLAARKGRVKPQVQDVIRLAVFEGCYLHTPAHAAVSQAVEAARALAPYARGFVNAVVRATLENSAPQVAAARERVASGVATPKDLSLAAALPAWLVAQLGEAHGQEQVCALAAGELEPAPVYVAANTLATSPNAFYQALCAAGAEPRATELANVWELAAPAAYLAHAVQREGIVSDLSAQWIARLAVPAAGERLLELGQGRGTKTLLMASAARAQGWPFAVTGVELEARRAAAARERFAAFGVEAQVVEADATQLATTSLATLAAEKHHEAASACGETPFGQASETAAALEALPFAFDVVLLDAPCSGTGTMRRHPEIPWRLTPGALDVTHPESLPSLQRRLLEAAATQVAPGGRLVYATCSVLPQENEACIQGFLATPAGAAFERLPFEATPGCKALTAQEQAALATHLTPAGAFATMPAPGKPDGHYAVCLRRKP